jgi:hypothetical protein
MDPLSIIASSLAVAGAARLALTRIRNFRAADANLLALGNELTDLGLILQDASKFIQHQKDCGVPVTGLIAVLENVKASLERLEDEVTKWSKPLQKTTTKEKLNQARKLRWINVGTKASKLKEEFRDLRGHLSAALSASSV